MISNTKKINIREQVLEKGLLFPSDDELVMLILGKGTRATPITVLAKNVISTLNSSNNENRIKKLLKINGMGNSKALAIAAAIELGRRRTCHLQAVVQHPSDIVPFVKNYALCTKEHFICITLNGAHEIINIRVISIGTINKTVIHPREIFADALKENAAAIIVCHNHPSGNVEPSSDDIATTETLIQCSDFLGIPLIDHIIVNKNSYFSFLENNILFN